MPALPEHMTIDALRDLAVAAHPEFEQSTFTLLSDGWDSVGLDVDDRFILKFPRRVEGEEKLRREARLLAVIRPRVDMPLPELEVSETPVVHTLHAKLTGAALDPATYSRVPEAGRATIGEQLGRFYAQLHDIDANILREAGGGDAEKWLDAETIQERIIPHLPASLLPWVETALDAFARLAPDPLGTTYGFFDGHGWNMAYDRTRQRLNGVFDFGDSGFGPVHREFVYSYMISPDLTRRIIDSYERHSGRAIDRQRVLLLSDAHCLWEIAQDHLNENHMRAMLDAAHAWLTWRG